MRFLFAHLHLQLAGIERSGAKKEVKLWLLNYLNFMNSTVGQDGLSSVLNVLEGGFLRFGL